MHFCLGCGARLGEQAEAPQRDPRSYTPKHLAGKILQSKSALEGERKQVTVLFADVKGSMELAEQVDAEEWHGILDRFFQILADGVHRFEGTVNQYTGDGIMALFGAPIAHEDHAQRACYASLHLRDKLRTYAEELKRTRGLTFSVRMGLNSGEVVVGKIGDDLRMDYTAQGQTVGLAERLEQLADPGTAYVGDPTARLVEGFFQLRDIGEFHLKGVSEPVRVHELQDIGPARTRLDVSRYRGFTRFVGRHDEMTGLEAALHRAVEGHGQVVGVVGEAGVGKSRLCAEFVERCRAQDTRVFEAHCPAYGKAIPLLPILDLLRDSFAITEQDSDQLAREKIAGRLLLLDEAFRETLPLVFDFLGVPDPDRPGPQVEPEDRRRELFAFVRRLVQARSEKEAAVLFLDDLHWIDAASDEFVAQLVEATVNTRTLLLLNFRPGYVADWTRKSYYQQLPLTPLRPEEVAEMVTDLLGSDDSVALLPALIQERSGGNPFFTEEVVLSLVESGALQGGRGAYRLMRSIEDLEVPATVQALLTARIDRLCDREKQVLHTAAVIGREFSETLLSSVVDLSAEDLASSLSRLQASEFIVERAIYPVAEYAFKHPLTEQVARESQLQDRRRRIHAAVARAIEEIEADKLDEQAALLAHHWDGAGQPLLAARWHRRAAEWAGASHGGESLRHWREVRRLLDRVPETEETIDLGVEARARIVMLIARWLAADEDVTELLEEGRELARRSQDPRVQIRFLSSVGGYSVFSGKASDSIAPLEEARQLADDLDDRSLQLTVRYWLSNSLYHAGLLRRALRTMDESLELLEQADTLKAEMVLGYDPESLITGLRSCALAYLGRFAEARRSAARSIEVVRRRGDVRGANAWASVVDDLRGEADEALSHARRAVEGAERIGWATGLAFAYHMLGRALLLSGQPDQAIEALERVSGMGVALQELLSRNALALAYLAHGDLEQARATAEASIAAAAGSGAKIIGCDAHLALATVLLRTRGVSAREQIEAEIARAQELVETTGCRARQPAIHEARAELARLLGDDATCNDELREAHRLYTEMGATGHAERLARELGL